MKLTAAQIDALVLTHNHGPLQQIAATLFRRASVWSAVESLGLIKHCRMRDNGKLVDAWRLTTDGKLALKELIAKGAVTKDGKGKS